jgi:hypothetical protein
MWSDVPPVMVAHGRAGEMVGAMAALVTLLAAEKRMSQAA